jgi:hypothetical protein
MTQFTFVGCSLTQGVGLSKEKDDPGNYANLIARKFDARVKNLAVAGNNNHNIFLSALNEIIFSRADTIFVQWSALHRLWLYPGPDVTLGFSPKIINDFTYRDLFFSKKDLQKLVNTYHLLNHDYNGLMQIINYSKILESVSDSYSTQVIFINGLLPWTPEILNANTADNYAQNLSKYSKELLDFDTRNDTELNKFFTDLTESLNSLQCSKWVNMFDSLWNSKIDLGNDDEHPGPESHKLYAAKIINYLTNDKKL